MVSVTAMGDARVAGLDGRGYYRPARRGRRPRRGPGGAAERRDRDTSAHDQGVDRVAGYGCAPRIEPERFQWYPVGAAIR